MILDGKKTAAKIRQDLIERVKRLDRIKVKPKLVIYWVGENQSSAAYIRQKEKMAEKIGATCQVKKYQSSDAINQVINDIIQDNQDPLVHGIIVQIPLPSDWDKNSLIQAIDPKKDVDGLTSLNQWQLMTGNPMIIPATAKGILRMLRDYQIDIAGKKVVVVGRSNLVGLPTALLALQAGGTVTVCHRQTNDLGAETKMADILIVASGQPGLITAEHVKSGAVIIDVGITRQDDLLVGDVDFAGVETKVKAISPVPGGVGPMTVICLLENLVEAAEKTLEHK